MEGVQKRPLTGMVVSGVAVPRAISAAAPPTVIHTLDNTTDQLGGPYVDMVTLWVNNTTIAAIDVLFSIAGGAVISVSVPALSSVKVFDDAVFANAPGVAAVQILAQAGAVGATFWGDFARVL